MQHAVLFIIKIMENNGQEGQPSPEIELHTRPVTYVATEGVAVGWVPAHIGLYSYASTSTRICISSNSSGTIK
jgi:hypothetical protein